MSDAQDYLDVFTKCLISFQYIEEALKGNLIRMHALIYHRIKKYVRYDLKPNVESINNAAMGRLIDMYKIFIDDNDLIADLRRIKKHRDTLAHQGLLMTAEEIRGEQDIELKVSELEGINELATKSFKRLVDSWTSIEAALVKVASEQECQSKCEKKSASG